MKYNYFILIAFFFFLCACQKEETRITNPSGPDVSDGSSIVSLLTSISLKDGSTDNAIDSTSRLSVNFPIEVSINDAPPITISSAETVAEQIQSYTDSFEIIFPITAITSDYTEVVIENYAQLQVYQDMGADNDMECLDFSYPISISAYNTETETFETIVIDNDEEMFSLLMSLSPEILFSFDYPITVLLSDGTDITINSDSELTTAFANAVGTCDEDDDPYNQESIMSALISCQWNFSDAVGQGTIAFHEDGSLAGYTTTIEFFLGTWNLEIGNEDILTIDVPGYGIEVEGEWTVSGFYAGEIGYYLSLNGAEMILAQNCTPQNQCSTTITACEMGSEVGYAGYILAEQDNCMIELAGMDPEMSEVSYYISQNDAEAGTNQIISNQTFVNTVQFSQYIYVRVEDPTAFTYEIIVILLITEDC